MLAETCASAQSPPGSAPTATKRLDRERPVELIARLART